MKRILITSIFLLYVLSTISQQISGEVSDRAQRFYVSLEELSEGFENPDMLYAPFMFWLWDEHLNIGKMEEMAEKMISQGINSGYAHPRRSMNESPGLPDEQWLGKEWFDAFKAVTAIAREKDSYFGHVDEYWWPILRAHGRVLKENPDLNAFTLETEILEIKGGTKIKIPESSFAIAARVNEESEILSSSLKRLNEGNGKWKAPEGSNWRLFIFTKKIIDEVNYMDTNLGDKFIDIAIEPYDYNVGKKLWKPYSFDISEFIKPGKNTIKIRVGNRVDNYYTNPVPSGLIGPVMISKYTMQD